MTPPFPGDWRPAAPTLAQVEAHGGWWWTWSPSGAHPPVADRLTVDDERHEVPCVVTSEVGLWCRAEEWDEGASERWRCVDLVCPCDANGSPVAWP